MQNLDVSEFEKLWRVAGPALFCTILTGFITHYLTKDRDAQARKAILEREADIRRRHFRRHVLRCRYVRERTPHNQPDEVWRQYAQMAPDLLAEAALGDGDFRTSSEFKDLVRRAGEWRRNDAEAAAKSEGKDLRDVLRDSIFDVYTFTIKE